MSLIDVRRMQTSVEDIFHEGGPRAAQPLRRGFIAAVLTNPYAGRYEPDILPMMEALNPLGLDMAHRLLKALDVPVERIEGYGKGAIIGSAGELEHGALWHVPGGYAMRELLGWKGDAAAYKRGESSTAGHDARRAAPEGIDTPRGADQAQPGPRGSQIGNALAIVPSTKKVGGPGATLDVPLTHINASYVRSHFDAIEVRVSGHPRPDELVVVLAMSCGARVHARVGGLAADKIAKWDGQR
jgi:hypothetical protein